ncbi:hypothetical protein VTK73DRAFT_3074 [Phialemonium thermophilum]|uniref:Gylcosyl hydrolase 115 C-terminal domain-containing protein n=1 Tax=Phialemonium thermophilum TaxID=223376 RepID=A0ABR3X0X1_9PEZI
MRNTLPAMSYVQTAFPSLAGHVGVGVEGSNATVQGDDKWHANSGNSLAVPPMDPYGPVTRWFDVFSRGTNSCAWNAAPWVPWVKLSQYNGTVGGSDGQDARVFISIDWENAPKGPNTTVVNINVTTPCRSFDKYGYPEPTIQVPVQIRSVPDNFTKGFVESDGHVAIEGPHFQAIVPPSGGASANSTSSNGTVSKLRRFFHGNAASAERPTAKRADSEEITYHVLESYGRTSGGVSLWPQNLEKLSLDAAPALEYSLYLFSNTSAANVTLYISPSQNYLGDGTPLEYGIALFPAGDPQPKPTLVRPVGNTVGTGMPDGWGYAVADGVWGHVGNYTTSRFAVDREGAYTLRVWCLLPSIVVQKIVVDLGGVRPSYLGPPESFLLSRDVAGEYNQTSYINEVDTLGGAGNGSLARQKKTGGAGSVFLSWGTLALAAVGTMLALL